MWPDIQKLAAAIESEMVFAQVLIRREGRAFELRHIADKDDNATALQWVEEKGLRALAQADAEGAFRPLKSAPNLRRGWRTIVRDEPALRTTLSELYPGAVADWFAAQSPIPPITSYRNFTGRQTGMYRNTTTLDDSAAATAIQKCCHKDFCLKRRLWSVEGLAPDAAEEKSVIPCLEPCAILLESARKAANYLGKGEVGG